MGQNVISNFIKKQLPFVLLIGAWIISSLVYISLKQSKETAIYAGILIFIGLVGLEIVSVLLTFLLWKRTTGQEKTLFGLFSISFLLLAVHSIIYIIAVDILGTIDLSLYFKGPVPFTGFLIFQFLAWTSVFLKSKPS